MDLNFCGGDFTVQGKSPPDLCPWMGQTHADLQPCKDSPRQVHARAEDDSHYGRQYGGKRGPFPASGLPADGQAGGGAL